VVGFRHESLKLPPGNQVWYRYGADVSVSSYGDFSGCIPLWSARADVGQQAFFNTPVGERTRMRNGPDSTAVVRAPEAESFGNRKLIRPSLSREQVRVSEAATERRERAVHAPERAPGTTAKKTAPAEQTHAENFYYQKQMQSKTPRVRNSAASSSGMTRTASSSIAQAARPICWSTKPASVTCSRKAKSLSSSLRHYLRSLLPSGLLILQPCEDDREWPGRYPRAVEAGK